MVVEGLEGQELVVVEVELGIGEVVGGQVVGVELEGYWGGCAGARPRG